MTGRTAGSVIATMRSGSGPRVSPRRRRETLRKRTNLKRISLVVFLVIILAAAAIAVARRLRETPKVEPAFESLVDDVAGPVKSFALS